jgi:lysozyme
MNYEKAIEIIKEFEGLRLVAYLCPRGIPTIGYGHTKTVTHEDVENKLSITKEKAEELLMSDLKDTISNVDKIIFTPLNENQFNALYSFVFNIGIWKFEKSTLFKYVTDHGFISNADGVLAAGDEFLKWVFAGGHHLDGLERRRLKERSLFLS